MTETTKDTLGGGVMARMALYPDEQVLADYAALCWGFISTSHEGRLYVTTKRVIWLRYRWIPWGTDVIAFRHTDIRHCVLDRSSAWGDSVRITLADSRQYELMAGSSVGFVFLAEATSALPLNRAVPGANESATIAELLGGLLSSRG